MGPARLVEDYGYQWPMNYRQLDVELAMYRFGEFQVHRWTHLRLAIQLLYKPADFAIHSMVDRMGEVWCDREEQAVDFTTIWGPGSIGKSCVEAMLALMDWLADVRGTITKIFTTSMGKQGMRIFGEIEKFYDLLPPERPGKKVPSLHQIKITSFAGKPCKNAGIFCFAVVRDSKTARVASYGAHNLRNRMLIDEMQGTSPDAFASIANMATGGLSFKFCGWGNPDSETNLLGYYSMPEGGVEALSMETEEWNTYVNGQPFGRCLWLNGLKSPRIVDEDGEQKYPFLLGANSVEFIQRLHGTDHIDWYSQVLGFMPPKQLVEGSLIEPRIVTVSGSKKPYAPGYDYGEIVVPIIDPSFANGGDVCKLMILTRGNRDHGMQTGIKAHYDLTVQVPQGSTRGHAIAQEATDWFLGNGCAGTVLAIDATGSQGFLADIFQNDHGWKLHRLTYNGAATKAITTSGKAGNEEYANRITEMWYRSILWFSSHELRGVYPDLEDQLIQRLWKYRGGRYAIESKLEYKSRYRRSPDDADAFLMGLDCLQHYYGITPEAKIIKETEAFWIHQKMAARRKLKRNRQMELEQSAWQHRN